MGFKFNPFTGNFDLVGEAGDITVLGEDNFSYIKVESGQDVVVPLNQEMVYRNDLMVEGNLMVRGNTYQIQDPIETSFFWTTIPNGTTVRVPTNRLMLYSSPLMVQGNLYVDGLLKEVS